MSKYRLIVNKVPLDTEIPDIKPNFGPLPQLYLELLENKSKLRKDILEKEANGETIIPSHTTEPTRDSSATSLHPQYSNPPPLNETKLAGEHLGTQNDISTKLEMALGENNQQSDYRQQPPSLDEIHSNKLQQEMGISDVKYSQPNKVNEEEQKKELLFKFDILRKSYPTSNIPDFNEYSDLLTMKRSYDRTVRSISLDSNVEQYKTWLIGGFMAVEYFGTKWLNLDFAGYTAQQMIAMNKYERLLIELGEKTYLQGESNWPVEFRLIGTIIINAAIFLAGKLIMKNAGPSIGNVFKHVFGPQKNSSSQSQPPPTGSSSGIGAQGLKRRKKRMRGPTIDLDDIDPEKQKND